MTAALSACFAAAAFLCAFLTGMTLSTAIAATGGACLLFSYSEITRAANSNAAHPLVSGELSRALFFILPAFVFFGGFGWPAAAGAGIVFVLFEILFFSFVRSDEQLFTGFVSHAMLAILLSYLALRGYIKPEETLSLVWGPMGDSGPVSMILLTSGVFLVLSLIVLPRSVRYLAPVSCQAAPFMCGTIKTIAVLFRELALFAAFLMSGAFLIPFDLFRAEHPVISRISALLLYLAISFAAAAAVESGSGAYALAAAAALSYIRFILHQRRKRDDAHRQRSFMHSQRRGRS